MWYHAKHIICIILCNEIGTFISEKSGHGPCSQDAYFLVRKTRNNPNQECTTAFISRVRKEMNKVLLMHGKFDLNQGDFSTEVTYCQDQRTSTF